MGKPSAEKKDRYFGLHHYMLKTDAWKALSAAARAVYIQIGLRYDGFNNGRISFSVRDAASECGLAKDTASRAFKELGDLGFIEETRHGSLSRKTRIASEWRLTAFKCDLTGSLKTCLFMQRGAQARDHRQLRSRPQASRGEHVGLSQTTPSAVLNDGRECPKRRYSPSQTTPSALPECPKRRPVEAVFGGPPVLNDGTHIIYQSVVSSDEAAQALADDPPTPRLTPPPAPPSPLVLWAEFSPSKLRRPASVGAALPRKPDANAIVEPIDGVYLIGGRRIEVLDQTALRNVARLADLQERPAQRTTLPSNAQRAGLARLTVDALTATPGT
jgi:hypothetical protein